MIFTKQRAVWMAIVPVAIATASLLPSTVFTPNPILAQERDSRILTVTGEGTESLPTTLASISLAVQVMGPTAEAVQQDMSQRSAGLVEFLNTQPIEKLTTTGIQLHPRYDYSNDEQRIVGYTASNMVRFDIAIDEAGDILDEAVSAGATRIDGIQFRATDEAIATAQRQALRLATTDAQSQADAVLDALGFTQQEIVGVQINHARPPAPPMPPFASLRVADVTEESATPVMGGEQDVQSSVTLQIRY